MNATKRTKHTKGRLFVSFVCFAVTFAFAWAPVTADSWIKVGPEGGLVRQVAQTSTPGTLYVATDAGVFRSTDAGAEWESTNQGLEVISVTALAVAPSDPARLYAAGGGANFTTSEQLNTIFRTTDGGGSWRALPLPSPGSLQLASTRQILVDPLDADIIYLARDPGIFKSTDAGETWSVWNLREVVTWCSVFTLAVAQPDSATLLAGTGCGVFKTTDSGQTWRLSSSGMVPAFGSPPSVSDLLLHPRNSCLVWAYASGSIIWRSTDCGETWSELPKIDSLVGFLSLAAHIQETATLYGVTPDGVYRTTNSGQSWSLLAGLAGVVPTGIWADQADPHTLWLGTSLRGLFRSTDGGSTWHPRNSGLTAISISGVSIDPRDSDVVYAGTYLKSLDGGSNWTEMCTTGPRLCSRAGTSFLGAPLRMIIDPQNPDTLYLPTREGVIKSQNGGGSWALLGSGLPKNRAPWLVTDPVRSGVLYASAGGLFKTTDGALTFQPLAAFSAPLGLTYDVAVDWHDPNLLYAGSLEGLSTSNDGGQTWTPTGSGVKAGVGRLETDPSTRGTVYAVSEGLWKSVDAGSNWTQILADPGIQALAIDRTSPRRLFAYSISNGVIRSVNGGMAWTPVNVGLPKFGDGYVPVNSISVAVNDPSVVYLATAQGVFKMRDEFHSRRRRRPASRLN